MLMIYKNSIVQFYSKNHKNIFFIVILQRFDIKEAGLKPCFFYVTLSPRRKCELPIPEVTRLRTMSCEKTKVERVRTIANPSLRSLQIFSLRPRKKGNEHSLPFLRGLSSVDVNQIFR